MSWPQISGHHNAKGIGKRISAVGDIGMGDSNGGVTAGRKRQQVLKLGKSFSISKT